MSEAAWYLYTDGGVVERNPGPAAAWAWCLVAPDGRRVAEAAGIVLGQVHVTDKALGAALAATLGDSTLLDVWPGTAKDPHLVSNNVAEWVAAVKGLETLPDGWCGYLAADSIVTLNRLLGANATVAEGVMPLEWWVRGHRALARIRSTGGQVQRYHVKGHPTKAARLRGTDAQGRPVSLHNVHVDHMCGQRKTLYTLLRSGPVRIREEAVL